MKREVRYPWSNQKPRLRLSDRNLCDPAPRLPLCRSPTTPCSCTIVLARTLSQAKDSSFPRSASPRGADLVPLRCVAGRPSPCRRRAWPMSRDDQLKQDDDEQEPRAQSETWRSTTPDAGKVGAPARNSSHLAFPFVLMAQGRGHRIAARAVTFHLCRAIMSTDRDLEQAVAKDASDFIRELEVERVLRAFKLKCVPFLLIYPSCTFVPGCLSALLTISTNLPARTISSTCQLELRKMKSKSSTARNRC